ncbi:MAG TPA: DUF4157 domain-containing protein [Jatrophihabitans sp.]|uniref:eCIS core domain-containing protein n=1 Tax=Jatrophihabitans sp. TaxID=1932789 RepID=UPI002EF7227F
MPRTTRSQADTPGQTLRRSSEATPHAGSESACDTDGQPVRRSAMAGLALTPSQVAPLQVGAADDAAEIAADQVAHDAVRALRRQALRHDQPGAPCQHPAPPSVLGTLQRRMADPVARRESAATAGATIGAAGGPLPDSAAAEISSLGSGQPLPAAYRAVMQQAMGADLGRVRVHTGPKAAQLNRSMQASAFTVGQDIYFRDGLPDLGTTGGQHLLAHELAHTLQGDSTVNRLLVNHSDVLGPVDLAAEDLIPDAQPIGEAVRARINSADRYYLPDTPEPDLADDPIHFLEERVYLLGEQHGDGTWEARTGRWSYIRKAREGVKSFEGQDATEKAAIPAPGAEVALEDMHAYILTRIIAAQRLMGYFDTVKLVPAAVDVLREQLEEFIRGLMQYRAVSAEWQKNPPSGADLKASTRYQLFGELAYVVPASDAFAPLLALAKDAARLPDAKQVKAGRKLLKESALRMLDLIDDRALAKKLLAVLGNERVGADPIADRDKIVKLASDTARTDDVTGPVEALDAVNPLREQAMVNRIAAAGAPLFVQIGQAHVVRVGTELRKRGIKVLGVDSSDDFLALLSRSNPPRQGPPQQPVPVAPPVAGPPVVAVAP